MDIITFLRQYRVGPFALFDIAVSYIGIYLLAPQLSKFASKLHLSISRTQWLWLTLPLGVLVHVLVGQQTALNKMLLNPNGDFLMKIVLIYMTYKGLKDVGKRTGTKKG